MSKMYIKPFGLDMGNYPDEEILAMQGDTMSRYVRFKLYGGSGTIDLTGCYARFSAIKPDGTRIFNEADIVDHVNGVVDVELTSQTLAVAGAVKGELLISKDGARLSSFPFVVRVVKTTQDDNAVLSNSEFNALDRTIDEIKKASAVVQHADNILEETGRKYLNQMEQERQEVDNIYQKITKDENVKAMTTVRANEQTRVEAEKERVSNESERTQNETIRVKQEKLRIEKEGLRNSSEQVREQNEATRKSNESSRESYEHTRVLSEQERATQEQARQANERVRQSEETTRQASEVQRGKNEEARIATEATRTQAETLRDTTEKKRISQEQCREDNEAIRIKNEEARVKSESLRVDADTKRDEAEKARATEWELIKDSYKEKNLGDMKKLDYDSNGDGIVDKAELSTKAEDSEKLGGKSPSDFVLKSEFPDLGKEMGDMKTEIYDKDKDGIVDKAKDTEQLGGKPAEMYALKGETGDIPTKFTWNYLANRFTWGNLIGE